MPLWKNTQHAFTAGQLDTHVMGRQDMDRYFKGATLLKNFLVKRQGCISKRRGTDLTADLDGLLGTTYDGTPIVPDKMRLVPVTNGDDGRYVILSGGLAFVADRRGIMRDDGDFVRAIDPYVAVDADGKPVVSARSDSRASNETPVDVVHTISAGNYAVTRYGHTYDANGHVTANALQNAIAGAQSGDTIRLHGDLMLEPGLNAQNQSVLNIVTVNKTLTIDLYGHKITVYGRYAYIAVSSPGINLTITSTRPGAQYITLSDGNSFWLKFTPYTSGSSKSGTLTLDGDISWKMLGGNSNFGGITAQCAEKVVINSGRFEYGDIKAGEICYLNTCGEVVVNDGTFRIRNCSDTSNDTKYVFRGWSVGSFTVNGGEFLNENTNSGSSAIFTGLGVSVYGGRFSAPTATQYFSSGTFSIFRGEFAHDNVNGTAIAATGYYQGSRSAGSTSETFSGAGVTATASAWTISDDGNLHLTWNVGNVWLLYGTRASGTYVSESVPGNPADTTIEFPCGITATRSWTFSDGGEWIITYNLSASYWRLISSEANSTQPNAAGYYGVRRLGESDYTYAHTTRTIPYRIAVPYADADLADLCIRQSGDTLFIAHRDYAPGRMAFDSEGRASYEEIRFDNTDLLPPFIDSAEMDGQDPKETDWPKEFPRLATISDSSGDCEMVEGVTWYVGMVPSWITDHDDDETLNGTSKPPIQHLIDFVNSCKALGTVTDAGYSGTDASSDDDGSYSRAATFTCTSVDMNQATGRKTTTVSVISFTSSRTIEKTTTFTDGLATGCDTDDVDTFGVASNSASAASVLVSRTVRYVATYVKDGMESRPSIPVAVDYFMPWANNAVVNIVVSKGDNGDEPDYYNVYKDNGNGYGLIGTVGVEASSGAFSATVDEYATNIPDNSSDTLSAPCLMDYLDGRGIGMETVMRKICSVSNATFSTSPAGDACLICPPSRQSAGMTFRFPTGTRFKRMRVYLDGRIYDKATNSSYLVPSAPEIKLYATYRKTDGTSAQMALGSLGYIFKQVSFSSISGRGYLATVAEGAYGDWLMLPRRSMVMPNGDTLHMRLVGIGSQTEYMNAHPRYLEFDISQGISSATDFSYVDSVTLKFDGNQYLQWSGNRCTGVVRALKFFSSSSDGTDGGNLQDDYINPDMTVTPPDDTQDPHFSAAGSYPGCVGIYEQRLVFASTRSSPSTIWMSRIADLYNFTAHESIREDDAMELTLAATEFPNINHLVMGRDLMLFGDGGEWLIAPVSGNALTYKTASAKLQSMIGSDRALQPMQLADETLFAERGGTCLRSINYNYTSDSYQSEDLSVIAQSVFRANPIVSMAYKQHPDSIVECVLKDGRVATLVYMKEQEVAAWSVQELGGGWKAREIVTPKCIVNGTTEMMLLVERAGVFQLWKVRDDDDAPSAASQVVLDGMHVETSAEPTGTDEEGVALGDGRYAIGYPVESEFVSVRPEPERGATAQMEIKNATEAEVRVTDATSFSVKPYGASSGWREVALPVTRDGNAVMLASKDCKKLMTGSNNRDGRIHLKHVEPWPLTILSVSTTYQVEYENGGNEQ